MMQIHFKSAMGALLLFLLSAGSAGDASEAQSKYKLGDSVPLSQEDLDQITSIVLKENPLLASSPGIKFSDAQRSVRSTDLADVIWYPHTESGGFKYAFQVGCWRTEPETAWTCNEAEIRRYMQVDSQDYEVRVIGDLQNAEALALVEATRKLLAASRRTLSSVPTTAVLIRPKEDSYLVSWGSAEGYQDLFTLATLVEGGDPTDPDHWQTSLYELGSR